MIRVDCTLSFGAFRLSASFESDARALALFGPSGCGKSTILRLIAGLARPERGRIEVGGRVLVDTEHGVFVPPHRRRLGLVFQDALLFPHLSVRRNLLYGAPAAGAASASAPDIDALVELLGIGALLERKPASLSGGERQRVAIGRALLACPDVLLLDEPLAALDQARKLEILPYIVRLRDDWGVPLVYVSHAIDEIARLAQHVVVLEAGQVRASGSPGDVLAPVGVDARGDTRFAAVSVVEAIVREHDEYYGITRLEHPAGVIGVPGRVGRVGHPYRVVVRASDVALAVQRPRDVSLRTVLIGEISAIDRDDSGPIARVELRLRGSGRLVALVTRQSVDELALDRGDEVFAMVKGVALDERNFVFGPAGR